MANEIKDESIGVLFFNLACCWKSHAGEKSSSIQFAGNRDF